MNLIPRKLLFGAPSKSSAQISPDGRYLSYIAMKDGVKNIWVGPSENLSEARCVSNDRKRGIQSYSWSYIPGVIIYTQDLGGDENFGIYQIFVETGETKVLFAEENVRVDIEKLHHKSPNHVLVAMNKRDPKFMDYCKLDLMSGEIVPVYVNESQFSHIVFDHSFLPRTAERINSDSSKSIFHFNDLSSAFELFAEVPFEDSLTTTCYAMVEEGGQVLFADSRGRNTTALKLVDFKTKQEILLAEHPNADVMNFNLHWGSLEVRAVEFDPGKPEWIYLNSEFESHMKFLEKQEPGRVTISSQAIDDSKWVVFYSADNVLTKYYLYETRSQQLKFLFELYPELSGFQFHAMDSTKIKSRDGLELVSYLTRPRNPIAGVGNPNPLVLSVHGGPWHRDVWGYNPQTQLLADRGYTVLSVNFRGSVGFGKDFVNASNGEWGGKMHDDLIDACKWAIDEGIADPQKIAVVGASYGGYAALVGLTFTPDFFACAIDVVGPSDLNSLLSSLPAYWEATRSLWKRRVGDFESSEGQKFLAQRSPLNFVDRICKPLLILHGANDQRVKKAEADQIFAAMKNKSIHVEYFLFPDEGHGFYEPRNCIADSALTELFLAKHLGGRLEPIVDEITNSSAQAQQ